MQKKSMAELNRLSVEEFKQQEKTKAVVVLEQCTLYA